MRNICKYGVIALSIMISVITTGCIGKNNKIDESNNTKQAYNKRMSKGDIKDGEIVHNATLLSIGDKDVSFSETMVYIMLYKSNYEGLLTDEIWSYNVEKNRSFEQVSKECIINQIVTSKVIEYGAEKLGVAVEPDEKIEIEDKAIECYKNIFKKLNGKYGVTQSVVKKVLYDNYLAEKVYEVATNDVKVEVKKSESKVPTVKQIEVLYDTSENDSKKDTSDKKISKDEAYKNISKDEAYKKISDAKDRLDSDGDNFTAIAEEVSDSETIDLEVTCNTNEKAYRKAALSLKEGETSEIIETSKGYYILYCVVENNEDAEKENEENIIKSRQDDMFAAKYEEWLREYDIYVVSELWNRINIGEA